MYCANCGVKLAPGQEKCPLCGLRAYHPDMKAEKGEILYPKQPLEPQQVSPWGARVLIAVAFFLPLLTCLACDLSLSGGVSWSGYVVGALLLLYVMAVLPLWFHKPNPVIFVPVDFAAAGVYLLYISLYTQGGWFLSFAFPVTAFAGLVTTAVVTLMRYVRRGALYVYGGAITAVGLFMPVMELLLAYTFAPIPFIGWSFYPLGALVLLGGFLIFLAICRPAREMMQRKFFL